MIFHRIFKKIEQRTYLLLARGSYLAIFIIFSHTFCARDFSKNYSTDFSSQVMKINMKLIHLRFFSCRQFQYWFIGYFVFFHLFCADLVSKTVKDMTMKFLEYIEHSLKLSSIKFYASDLISWGSTYKLCIRFDLYIFIS